MQIEWNLDKQSLEWSPLFTALNQELQQANETKDNQIGYLKTCLSITRAKVEELKLQLRGYTFTSTEDEIHFFKYVKPVFYGRLIYYLKLFGIETACPAGSSVLTKTFFTSTLDDLNEYFSQNSEFYQYYRSGNTYLDGTYFTRGQVTYYPNLDDTYFTYDASFSTSHDLQVARILAYEKLLVYVSDNLSVCGEAKESADRSDLEWTATKTGLIELLYALQSSGTFNNGSSDLKQLATYFERSFGIQLGNYYNVFQEMRLRKKNRTSFLDLLKERLIRRMDEADER